MDTNLLNKHEKVSVFNGNERLICCKPLNGNQLLQLRSSKTHLIDILAFVCDICLVTVRADDLNGEYHLYFNGENGVKLRSVIKGTFNCYVMPFLESLRTPTHLLRF